jgi:hypothetical protein
MRYCDKIIVKIEGKNNTFIQVYFETIQLSQNK